MSLVDTLGSASCIWNESIAFKSQVLGMTDLLTLGSWPRLKLRRIKPNDATTKQKRSVFNSRRLRAVCCAFQSSVGFRTIALRSVGIRIISSLSLPANLRLTTRLFKGLIERVQLLKSEGVKKHVSWGHLPLLLNHVEKEREEH
jgi:hypothetical protein